MAAAELLQAAKRAVLDHVDEFDHALGKDADDGAAALAVLRAHTAHDFRWRGSYPFAEQPDAAAAMSAFWVPLQAAMAPVQRREDIFLAGRNDVEGREDEIWACSMGHFIGLFDKPWLGIPPTGRLSFLRYVEFSRVAGGLIAESCLHCDVVSFMIQAGQNPLPPATGSSLAPHPGPRTHAGRLLEPQAAAETAATVELCNRMVADLNELNEISRETGVDEVPVALLAKTWHDDMLWYGPGGIGSTYTIARYIEQHSMPFRSGLADKCYNGHVARIAEGEYEAWFGWPNLTNRLSGGFLGLPEGNQEVEMRVVGECSRCALVPCCTALSLASRNRLSARADVYRRDGGKLAENWVFIDTPYYLAQQGLDVLQRMNELTRHARL
jgi:hypothetical protein